MVNSIYLTIYISICLTIYRTTYLWINLIINLSYYCGYRDIGTYGLTEAIWIAVCHILTEQKNLESFGLIP